MITADPWVLGVLAIGGLVSLTVAARRGGKQAIATAVAALALVGLAVSPTPSLRTEGAVLLTEGADVSQVVGGESRLAPSGGVYALGNDASWPRWVERIPDVGSLTRRAGLPGSLTIAGHGLDPWDSERLTAAGRFEIALTAVPPSPGGVTRVSWRRDLRVGQPLVVVGTVTGGGTLRLEGPGGSVERVASARTEETPFTLELVPPGPGRFLFDLSLKRPEGGQEYVGAVDVHVRESKPPKLLWLERAPSFETRHVKQWLTEAGGSLAVRTTVSRDRFRYEYHNLDRFDLSRLTPSRLQRFDVVVVDARAWADLPRSERRAIEEVVRSGTLGVVLRLDLRDGSDPTLPFGVTARRIADLDRLMVRPAALDDPPDPISIPPFELEGSGNPVFRDRAGRVLATTRPLGRGTIALTALTDSYRWVLSGRADAHRAYWISLLEAVAPPDDLPQWLLPGGPISEHEPLTVTLAGEAPAQVDLVEPDGRRAKLPLRQHPTRPDRFSTTLWPRQAGWHRLEAGDSVSRFHAVGRTDWQAWRMMRRRDATALAASRTTAPVELTDARTPWLRLASFAVLLAALAWAWIDERRSTA